MNLLLAKIHAICQELTNLYTNHTAASQLLWTEELEQFNTTAEYANNSLDKLRNNFSKLLTENTALAAIHISDYQLLKLLSSTYSGKSNPDTVSTAQSNINSNGTYQPANKITAVKELLEWQREQQVELPNNLHAEYQQLQYYSHYQATLKEFTPAGSGISSSSKALQELFRPLAVQVNKYTSDIVTSGIIAMSSTSLAGINITPQLYQDHGNYSESRSADMHRSLLNRFTHEVQHVSGLLSLNKYFIKQITDIKSAWTAQLSNTVAYSKTGYTREYIRQIYNSYADRLKILSVLQPQFTQIDPLIRQGITAQQPPAASYKATGTVNIVNNVELSGINIPNSGLATENIGTAATQAADYLSQQSMYLWQSRILNGTPLFG